MFVPKIWAKIISANQIVGFLYQPYPQNKSDFLHVDTNSYFWVGMVRNGRGESGHGSLQLTVSHE